MTNPDLITCETLEQQLADYLADALPQSAAEQLERFYDGYRKSLAHLYR